MLKPAARAIAAEHHHHEDDRRQIERADQLGEWPERADAIAADGEGHGPECPNRGELHDDVDRAEDEAARRIDHVLDGLPSITEPRQHASEQERDQHDGQDVAFCKRIDDRVRDHVQQELGDGLLLRLAGIGHDGLGIEGGGVGIEAGAGPKPVSDNQTDRRGPASRRPRNRAAPCRRCGRPSSCSPCRLCRTRRCRRSRARSPS